MGRVYFTDRDLGKQFPNRLRAAGLRVEWFLGHAPYPKLAKHFVNTLPRIEAFVDAHRPPYIAKVYRPTPKELARSADSRGTVSPWYSAAG